MNWLGEKMSTRMKELGIETQVELARRSGLSYQAVNSILRGKRGKRIEARTVRLLATALQVSPIFFLEDSSNEEKGDLSDQKLRGGR